MRAALVIAAKDLRSRFRDRSAIVLGFLAPVLIATLMSFAFQGTEEFHADVVVVDADGGPLATAFVAMLRSPDLEDLLTVDEARSVDEARAALDDGTASAAFVLPAGFSDVVHGGEPVPVGVLSTVDTALAGEVGQALAQSFVAQVNANTLSVATALAAGARPADAAELAAAAARESLPVQVQQRSVGAEQMRAISYYAPAMGIFFVLFAVTFGAKSFFDERGNGTLDRIAAAPVRPGVVLAGKALSTFVYAVLSLGTMAVVTTLVFDADWGPPWAAAVLVLCMAVVVVALTALVMALARTERQADGIASIVIFGLVLLGGNFVYVWAAPEALRRVALMTPNGWVMRAFTDMATGADAAEVLLMPVLVSLGFAAVAGGVAVLLARRAVLR